MSTPVEFRRRIGTDPHANGAQSVGGDGCPDIWELDNGDFAIIGIDITDAAIGKLPPTAGCCKRRLKSAAGGARKVLHLPGEEDWI